MRCGKLVLALSVSLLIAGLASAQGQGQQRQRPSQGFGGFGGGMGGGSLAGMISQNKQLQEELKVDKDQAEKVTAAMTKVRESMAEETTKLRDRNTAAEERTAIMKKMSEANDKAIASVLKPEQIKRMKQIENQRSGVGIFLREETQTALKLKEDQKEKIKAISDDLQKDLRALLPAAGAPGAGGAGGRGRPGAGGAGGAPGAAFTENAKKRQGLQKEAMTSVVKLLDADQKAAYKDMTGEPFDVSVLVPTFGAGGRGGRGGAPGKPGAAPGKPDPR